MEDIKKILEDTTGAAVDNIATTDQDLSVGQMYQQKALPSLGREIFSVVQMEGPTAALFNIKKDSLTNKFVLLRNEAEVFPSESINTGLTREVIQDIKSQYGTEAKNVIGTLLRGLSNEQENTKTLEFLESNCLAEAGINLETSTNKVEANYMNLIQKIQELISRANSKNQRTFEAFAVVPYKCASGVQTLSKYLGGDVDSSGLYIGNHGKTKFYLNPDSTSETVYVGLKDENNMSKSSAVFAPFADDIVEAQDPDTGEVNFFIFNRFSITASPLHEVDNEMLFKFSIA